MYYNVNMMTVRQVIYNLGRAETTAELGVSTAAVTNAIANGKFPAQWFDVMDKRASRLQVKLPREHFSWRRAEAIEEVTGAA